MARIIYCHLSQSKYDYHIYTDLDFWDSRWSGWEFSVV
jgi:hypothetical protein